MIKIFLFKLIAICIGISIALCGAEVILRVQNIIHLNGFSEQNPWNPVLHHGDDNFIVTDYGTNCTEGKNRILLLGDSWMADTFLSDPIGRELSQKSGKCIQTVNGGNSSYSPTLYLLKARQAFKKYGWFDSVIVNIDETDVGDEWLRYRIPLTRDLSGRIVAVPYEKDIRRLFFWNGKLWAESSDFYVVRAFKFALLYNVLVPLMQDFTVAPDHYATLMQYVFSPEAATAFVPEQRYFYDRLVEMADELSSVAHGTSSVYVTHHPHLRGFINDIEEGKSYLPVVSEAIAELGRETGVNILDARNHVEQIHGKKFRETAYVVGDLFSHLNSEGATRYGQWIGDQILLEE